jgi:hypothetical protein
MSSTTSSAEPGRLTAFGTTAGSIDDALGLTAAALAADAATFFTGAGAFAPPGSADDWVAPLRSLQAEVAHLGAWVAGVGRAFIDAGTDADGDGIYDAADDVLASRVGRAVLSEHRAYLAEQLSTLCERAASDERDLTPAEVAHVLAMARALVDRSPDPQAEAQMLIAAMGAADLDTAIRLLETGASDAASTDHPAVAGLLDLGHVVSLGLEGQPSRAERWADALVDHRTLFGDIPGGSAEGLAVMGAGNAPGTSVFGAEVFGGLLAHAGSTPVLGLVHRLYGTTDPLAPIVTTAATRRPDGSFDQAPLAHAIVRHAADEDDGRSLVRLFGGHDAPVAYDTARRDVLMAAVDPSLPADQRVRLSYDLAGHYVEARESPVATDLGYRFYSPAVTQGFAASTQPLLDHWQGDDPGIIHVETAEGSTLDLTGGVLWDAVGHLGEDPGGAEGLSTALGGTTTARLTASYTTAAERARADVPTTVHPFGPEGLDQLGDVYRVMSTTVGNARFQSVVDAAESDGGRLDAGITSVAYGLAGELPGGSTAAGVTEALDILTSETPEVTGGGSTTAGLAVRLTRDLVAFNLLAHPDLATPGLTTALQAAKQEQGDLGVYRLLHDDRAPLNTPDGMALADLQALVDNQEERIGLDLALAADELTRDSDN